MRGRREPEAAPDAEDLAFTDFLDGDAPGVAAFVERVVAGAEGEADTVSRLFAAVRDEIRYNPYQFPTTTDGYRASAVIESGVAHCVPKAVVLAAAARRVGIPSRIAFADVRNHLSTPKLREHLGTDVFAYHGYTLLFVGGRWRKASPAFNRELCERFGVEALGFDGTGDALMHPFDGSGNRYMEYIEDRGEYSDVPFDDLLSEYRRLYPRFVARMTGPGEGEPERF